LKRGVIPGRFQRGRRGISGRREMTGGVHLAAREREGESNGSGRGLPGLRARSGAGLKGIPGALFLLLFLSSLFFSDFYFFCIFCKKVSIQFKPLSEIF
jgi:hypothetical protein